MVVGETPYKPEDVGYNRERLEVLNAHFEKMIEKDEIQGASYCLARDGKVFANNAIGRFCYRKEDNRELQPDHIHKIASVTKLFCSTAIFKLVEDGKLRLDQKVGEFIEEFNCPPFNEINIMHLLTHTSGMQPDGGCFENPYFTSQWDFVEYGFQNGDENWIKNALRSGLRTKPGAEWAYSSFGFVLLGEIISRVSGTPVEDFITEHIVKPCEMNDSGFGGMTPEIAPRMVIRNERLEERINKVLSGQTEEPSKWDRIPSTGGGMYSNASDLIKFGTMLLHSGKYNGKHILGRKSVEKMTSRNTSHDVKDFCWYAGGVERAYALGPDIRHNLASFYSEGTFFHEGAGSCCLMIDPVEKLVAAWFVPFMNNAWYAHGLYNASAIMWSGLE